MSSSPGNRQRAKGFREKGSGEYFAAGATTLAGCGLDRGSSDHHPRADATVGSTELDFPTINLLTLSHATTLQTWQKAYFTAEELDDPAISGDLADPDREGLSNLFEYSSNSGPRTASVTNVPIVSIDPSPLAHLYKSPRGGGSQGGEGVRQAEKGSGEYFCGGATTLADGGLDRGSSDHHLRADATVASIELDLPTINLLTVSYATTLQTWQQAYFTAEELDDPAISGDLADPDREGLSNLFEYSSNSDPRTASVTNTPTVTSDPSYLSLTYTKVLAATDLTYTVEESIDLMNWSPAASIDQILLDDGVTQRIKANVLIDGADRLFLRLGVSR